MKKLLIFPFNGNGLEALVCLGETFDFIGFVDDTLLKQGKHNLGFDVYSRDAFTRYPEAVVLAVPGSPSSYLNRKHIIQGLKLDESRFAKVIHPAAGISPFSTIGYNNLIMAGVVLTSNAIIGNHVCILPNSVIHHDVIIGDYTLMGSNISVAGNSRIGANCYIGSGSRIINGIEIGNNALIGLGSNVIRTVPEYAKVAGNPAKIIK
jgi:sugar O-acyltransferase (sialic acid O-acetyltransferase NeuD family)